ncbi:uncharacterized protein [Bemisia tabaci]|uniref:uncharacterized protein n=1 Tax=Bemisia tabaci TaxID=7038 RepID=UPI003B288CF3
MKEQKLTFQFGQKSITVTAKELLPHIKKELPSLALQGKKKINVLTSLKQIKTEKTLKFLQEELGIQLPSTEKLQEITSMGEVGDKLEDGSSNNSSESEEGEADENATANIHRFKHPSKLTKEELIAELKKFGVPYVFASTKDAARTLARIQEGTLEVPQTPAEEIFQDTFSRISKIASMPVHKTLRYETQLQDLKQNTVQNHNAMHGDPQSQEKPLSELSGPESRQLEHQRITWESATKNLGAIPKSVTGTTHAKTQKEPFSWKDQRNYSKTGPSSQNKGYTEVLNHTHKQDRDYYADLSQNHNNLPQRLGDRQLQIHQKADQYWYDYSHQSDHQPTSVMLQDQFTTRETQDQSSRNTFSQMQLKSSHVKHTAENNHMQNRYLPNDPRDHPTSGYENFTQYQSCPEWGNQRENNNGNFLMGLRPPKLEIPKFEKSTAMDWLTRFEMIMGQYPDEMKKRQLIACLAKDDNQWLQNNISDIQDGDWQGIRKLFVFYEDDRKGHFEEQKKFDETAQGEAETGLNYVERKLRLAQRLMHPPPIAEIIKSVIKGLDESLKHLVYNKNPQTITDLRMSVKRAQDDCHILNPSDSLLKQLNKTSESISTQVKTILEEQLRNLNIEGTKHANQVTFADERKEKQRWSRRDAYEGENTTRKPRDSSFRRRSYSRDRSTSTPRYRDYSRDRYYNNTRQSRDRYHRDNDRYPSQDRRSRYYNRDFTPTYRNRDRSASYHSRERESRRYGRESSPGYRSRENPRYRSQERSRYHSRERSGYHSRGNEQDKRRSRERSSSRSRDDERDEISRYPERSRSNERYHDSRYGKTNSKNTEDGRRNRSQSRDSKN